MACFGPASGLRTMVFSRYSWGYYGASIMSIVNVMSAIGWAAVNSITGAQTLRVVFNDSFPITVGIIIIAIITMIISFIGYKWIHIYERYSWIPVFIGYCILAGVGAKYFTNSEMDYFIPCEKKSNFNQKFFDLKSIKMRQFSSDSNQINNQKKLILIDFLPTN
ncbi:unnamed protein product [Rotaria sp. Silwood1]|nr:unnamed protein product [Rotaria sp. Silwood1]CAF5017412.1 unnamed protein product [Rotaria sp. Silwood1]